MGDFTMADVAHSARKYDRDFLLSPEKRNQLIELWEVEKYGRDCFGDPDHVHLYGMKPKEWYERGLRILARTCLEAVKGPTRRQDRERYRRSRRACFWQAAHWRCRSIRWFMQRARRNRATSAWIEGYRFRGRANRL